MKTTAFLSKLTFCLMLALGAGTARAHHPAEEMVEAATNFLAALSKEQRAKAVFEFSNDERMNWHFIPKDRQGLPLKEMSTAQRHLAFVLLNSALSHRGFFKATTIMSLEQILHEMENQAPRRNAELYYFSIFGEPAPNSNWAWRVEGHHLSLNFTITKGNEIAVTPSFLGANPGEVRSGPRTGLRVLAAEEDIARQLVKSFDERQKKIAIYTNTAPADIITAAERKVKALQPAGISAREMTKDQRELMLSLLREYLNRYRPEIAEQDLKKINASGVGRLTFAWAGSLEPQEGHYYRIQGPTFLMEYDNTQNNANHIHAVWRDLENDFGEDVLRKHYDQDHTKK